MVGVSGLVRFWQEFRLQLAVERLFTPFGTFIGLRPLPLSYFPWLLVTLLAYSSVTQLIRIWYLRRFQVWL
jgi:hypothetical protein